jgi:tRNA 2-selenouridine synthase
MPVVVGVDQLLCDGIVIFDVRSPSEYHRGHIPCALNLPLFTDGERAEVGTLYKKKGKDVALLRGLDFFGPKMRLTVELAATYSRAKKTAIYCWRGGMRSAAVGWLLETAGFQVSVLAGGYKTYRRWALQQLTQPRRYVIIGGYTGSGKTWVLHAMRKMGEQVLDLEGLASHRGSTYGGLGLPTQPTQEHFENKLAYLLSSFGDQPIWIEDESRMIGRLKIPDALFEQMSRAPLFVLQRSLTDRIHHLLAEYGHFPREELIEATRRIRKRLGDQRTTCAVSCLEEGNLAGWIEQALHYYDKAYHHSLKARQHEVCALSDQNADVSLAAESLLQKYRRTEV